MKKKLLMAVSLWFMLGVSVHAGKRIVVDLSTQTATAYESGSVVFSGNISTGTAKRPTPTGSFRVLEKDIDHISTSWPKPNGGAKMHYMLRLTNYGIAMHLGYVPSYPASHGCIRLQNGFAQRMYRWAHVGVPVRVVGHAPARVYRSVARRKTATKKRRRRLTALGVFGTSAKAKEISLPKGNTVPEIVKEKNRHVKIKKRSIPYRTPSTLDVLSSSPKAIQRIDAAQKLKWKKKPKRKAPRVDPLKAMRV